jgi:hypothetical protein
MSTARHPHQPRSPRPGDAPTSQLDARPFFIERGSTVRVRQRAYLNHEAAAKGGFLLP